MIPDTVQRAQQGDEQAFAELYAEHKQRVYAICMLLVKDPATAEDLTQDTFIHAWRYMKTFRGDSRFSTWLYRVAFNIALMKLRKGRAKKYAHTVALEDVADRTFETRYLKVRDLDLEGVTDRGAIDRAINALAPKYRQYFILKEVEGYEHKEIAALCGVTIGNSKSMLHRAKAQLQLRLRRRDLALQPKNRLAR